jgi:thymidylate synthase
LLLHLFALQTGLRAGSVVGFFNNIEIFNQHIDGAKELIEKVPKKLGTIETANFTDILNWKFTDTQLLGYTPNDQMKFEVNISS